ncbi:MAG TPA: creatininase family protein [Patescibacteria group bacterium]|nr:creatininase family protein [Patescibacteria group bacterium]
MKKKANGKTGFILSAVILTCGIFLSGAGTELKNGLSCQYEELTAAQFVQAVEKAAGTCIIPLGVMEKHGEQLPLGTDLFTARETARLAAAQEYVIIFPAYYFSQIFEARHQPGTIAYSEKLIFDLLQETCSELARNGFKKIILFSGHGGNEHFLPYFCQTQLASRRDYAVYFFTPAVDLAQDPEVQALLKTDLDMHGGERETSLMLAIAPELVRMDLIRPGSGEDRLRLGGLKQSYTGIWWYASFPDHYAGDAGPANAELGKLILQKKTALLADMIREVKADQSAIDLQNKFFEDAEHPVKKK